jgi:ABC-type maltose transport system permease subunit
MAVVTGKSQRWRITLAHVGLWVLIAITLFPLLAVVSISLRPGNFATGSLIPSEISLEHWKLALGFSHTQADGCGGAAAVSGAVVAMEFDQDRHHFITADRGCFHHGGLWFCAAEVSLQVHYFEQHAVAANVSGGGRTRSHLCHF